MPKLVALLRVKDGILFINDWLLTMGKLVDEIVVVDNGSTDGTLEILQKHPKVVDIAQTVEFDEGRDKIMVYDMARKRNPDWCIWLDVDEIFENRLTRKQIDKMMNSKVITKYKFRRYHFHKDFYHFEARMDKLFEISWPSRTMWKEQESGYFENFKIHNGDIKGIKGKAKLSPFRIKHFGAVNKDYLEKKTNNYLIVDDDPARKEMYVRNLNQELKCWKWVEYDSNPIKVTLQNIFFYMLHTLLKILVNVKRLYKSLLG